MSNRITNKLSSFFLKIFTVGNRFSPKDFFDRLKKYAVEGIGIFIVISSSFYVENKGIEYEMTKSYLEMLYAFKKDIIETKDYADDFLNNLDEEVDIYEKQLEKWSYDNDSVFISSFEDKDGKYYYPPIAYFNNYNPFIPSKRGQKIFEMGGVDFELLNSSISESINEFYDKTLYYLEVNSTSYEKKYIQDFEDRVVKVWARDLDNVNITENEFWIKNRLYLQKDKVIYSLIKFRLNLWEEELYQIGEIRKDLDETLLDVNDLIKVMEDDVYFIYWKLY
tara:strand:+ start:3031 stop:3867 length:837 start_codon:yes stop_codon:yes gene_type:complete